MPARPPQPSTRASWASSPRSRTGAAGPHTGTQPSARGTRARPEPLGWISNPKSCPRFHASAGGKGDGGLEANLAAPQSRRLAVAKVAVAAGGLGSVPGSGCGGSPDARRGPRGAGGAEGTRCPHVPAIRGAWQAMKAQLCSSRAAAGPCLGSGPGWDSSPRQRQQMPRQEVPPSLGSERCARRSAVAKAGDPAHAPSPRRPTALAPLHHPPVRNGTFSPPGCPETRRHRGAWAGGLPWPAGDSPATGTIIG